MKHGHVVVWEHGGGMIMAWHVLTHVVEDRDAYSCGALLPVRGHGRMSSETASCTAGAETRRSVDLGDVPAKPARPSVGHCRRQGARQGSDSDSISV